MYVYDVQWWLINGLRGILISDKPMFWASIIQVYGVKKHKSLEAELLYLWIQ